MLTAKSHFPKYKELALKKAKQLGLTVEVVTYIDSPSKIKSAEVYVCSKQCDPYHVGWDDIYEFRWRNAYFIICGIEAELKAGYETPFPTFVRKQSKPPARGRKAKRRPAPKN